MQVTRDVIYDLLPAYAAGEASADTKRIVDDFLRDDVGLRTAVNDDAIELLRRPVLLDAGVGKRALDEMKRLIRRHTWFHALALVFTLVPFSIIIEGGVVQFLMLRDSPRIAAVYWLLAAICWGGYYATMRKLDVTGRLR
jgi:hypothetical protein